MLNSQHIELVMAKKMQLIPSVVVVWLLMNLAVRDNGDIIRSAFVVIERVA